MTTAQMNLASYAAQAEAREKEYIVMAPKMHQKLVEEFEKIKKTYEGKDLNSYSHALQQAIRTYGTFPLNNCITALRDSLNALDSNLRGDHITQDLVGFIPKMKNSIKEHIVALNTMESMFQIATKQYTQEFERIANELAKK